MTDLELAEQDLRDRETDVTVAYEALAYAVREAKKARDHRNLLIEQHRNDTLTEPDVSDD